MSEEILRIRLAELSTIRIKFEADGVIRELALDKIDDFIAKSQKKNELHPHTCEQLQKISDAFWNLQKEDSGVDVEFVIPVKK